MGVVYEIINTLDSRTYVGSSIRDNRVKVKGWVLTPHKDKLYTKEFVLSNLDFFDEDCYPDDRLVTMLKSL
tara:strand:+ start:2128 stop:2340 length:213 start_codon:yes stop_codon:yes gene_type:complete